MASLMEKLVDVLDEEHKRYELLLGLSKEKTQIIVKGDIKNLQETTEKEQILTNQILKLEQNREQILNDIAVVVGKDVSTLTVTNIIRMLEKQPEEQNRVKEAHDRLRKTLKEMVLLNNKNKQLIEHSLEMIEFDMTLLKSMRLAPETANYDKGAYSTGTLLNSGGFDAKQ